MYELKARLNRLDGNLHSVFAGALEPRVPCGGHCAEGPAAAGPHPHRRRDRDGRRPRRHAAARRALRAVGGARSHPHAEHVELRTRQTRSLLIPYSITLLMLYATCVCTATLLFGRIIALCIR